MLDLSELGLPDDADDGVGGARWVCEICGFVYDQALGLPEEGIAPGTPWDALPADWSCPDCGMAKSDFSMLPVD